jgi:hypothetical protein
MSKLRIWHSSRDAYHCAFRLICLLRSADDPFDLEKLRIIDLYFLYPTLIHKISMPQDSRSRFNKLEIPDPSEIFIQLPSPAALIQNLRIFQNTAIGLLVATGHLTREKLREGSVLLTDADIPTNLLDRLESRKEKNQKLINFLLSDIAILPLIGADSIYRRCGLPSRVASL